MRRLFVLGLALGAGVLSLGGCVLGSEQAPGCRVGHPDDCAAGFVCRAGACFRYNNEAGKPVDTSADGGADAAPDAADANSDAGATDANTDTGATDANTDTGAVDAG